MSRACVSDQNFFKYDIVITDTNARAWIDGVSGIDAEADRVAFDDLDAHLF